MVCDSQVDTDIIIFQELQNAEVIPIPAEDPALSSSNCPIHVADQEVMQENTERQKVISKLKIYKISAVIF